MSQIPMDLSGTESVLLVDDNPDIRRVLSLLMSHAGLNVLEAGDGQEALVIALEQSPAAIVADVQMPVMDGLELIRRLRSEPSTSAIPVLLFSGLPPHPDLASVLEHEGVRYMSKGDPRKMLEALQDLRASVEADRPLPGAPASRHVTPEQVP